MQFLYPDLYRIDDLSDANSIEASEDDKLGGGGSDTESEDEGHPGRPVLIPQPSRSQLSYERISTVGMYLLDIGDVMYVYICRGIHQFVLERTLGVTRWDIG